MTSSMATTTSLSDDQFSEFLDRQDESDAVRNQRRTAWQSFQSMEWPKRSEEEWIRTDIRLFQPQRYQLPSPVDLDPAFSQVAGQMKIEEVAGQIKSFNSCPVSESVSEQLSEQGVIFQSLSAAARDHRDLVEPHLMKTAFNPVYDRFASLHAACWSGGAFLYVPRGVSVVEPFHLLSIMGDRGTDFGHVLVVLEDGANATLVCETASDSAGDGFHCGGMELVVGCGANLKFVTFQNWNRRTWHFAHQAGVVKQDGQLEWTVGALGSRLAKVNQTVELVGPGAHCRVNGTMFTEGRQHLSYHTLQHHRAASATSDFLYKAALQDESRTVWRGMIRVEPEAQQTDGYQRNDNLMLSRLARADSIPGLAIEADDVRCTHGSTTGSVDDEMMFYAMNRGFTRKEAARMIVTGFFQQVFERVTVSSVREALGSAIAQRVREYE